MVLTTNHHAARLARSGMIELKRSLPKPLKRNQFDLLEHARYGPGGGHIGRLGSSRLASLLAPAASRRYVKLSADPQFIEKVRDILGLNLDPPDKALVICVDEKSQIQAINRTQPLLPMRPGQAKRRSHDYERHGMTTLFAGFIAATAKTPVKPGTVIGQCMLRHRAREFRKFLDEVERNVPDGLDIHVVMDNASTHKLG